MCQDLQTSQVGVVFHGIGYCYLWGFVFRPAPDRTYPPATATFKEPRYCKHTVNSALRSRSPSPMDRELAKGHVITDIINHKVKDWQLKYQAGIDDRDPFVVRKVRVLISCLLSLTCISLSIPW